MGKETQQATSVGFPLANILTIVFVIAKLAGVVGWSWWWVFSPLWVSVLLVIGILLLVLGFAAVGAFFAAILE